MSGSQSLGLPAYAGYGATPSQEALIMARRLFPYQSVTSAASNAAADATAPAAAQDASSMPGFDGGGVIGVSTGPATSWTNQQLIDLGLMAPGGDRASGYNGNAGQGSSPGPGGNANYGPTSQGFAGLAPSSTDIGTKAALAAAGAGLSAMGVPGSGVVGAIGNGFNSGVSAVQAAQMQAGINGQAPPGTMQNIGTGIAGALGFGQSPAQMSAAAAAAAAANPAGPQPTAQQYMNIAAQAPPASPALANRQFVANYGGGVPTTPLDLSTPSINVDGRSAVGSAAGNSDTAAGVDGDLGGLYARGGRVGLAIGGVVPEFTEHRMLRDLSRGSGLVHGSSPGRADSLVAHVPRGGYVMPADVVSGIGQGNTMAGARRMTTMLGGSRMPAFARGGAVGGKQAIRISAGEYFVHPKHVAALGGGDLAAGQRKLDQLVAGVRAQSVRQALASPPPR